MKNDRNDFKYREKDRANPVKFKGKVAWWFYGIILGTAALLLPMLIVSAFTDPNITALIITLLSFAAVEIFCIPIVFHNFAELQSESLLIVFGLMKKQIPYNDITVLLTTHNPTSSLAASLDRIEIKCKGKSEVMIALVDKKGFFDEIKKYNPDIKIDPI